MRITVQRRLFTGRVHNGVHTCDHRGSWKKKQYNHPLTPTHSTPFRNRILLGTRLKCLQRKGSAKSERKKKKTKHLSIAPSLIYFCFTGNIRSRNLQIRQRYMIDDHFKTQTDTCTGSEIKAMKT